jgi:WD40-like Beta Propeller Repeat
MRFLLNPLQKSVLSLGQAGEHRGSPLQNLLSRGVNQGACGSRQLFLASARGLLVLLCFFGMAHAQLLTGKGAELPLKTIQTPHFSVLHPPRLEVFSRRVAAAAEAIRAGVLGVVGNDPGRTYILVNDETDDFNGFAVPGPYPFIRVYATFPRPTDIGAQWQDAMHALVAHEFAHVAHLTTRDGLRQSLRGIFGAVPGLLEARVPPAWFVEGYAIYLESKLTSGGRVQDSAVRTLRAQMARAGKFPSLTDAGIGVNEDYPFGNTRYAYGAGFVPFLIERFGEATIRRAIALYNQHLTFADAWREVTNQSLESLWTAWTNLETNRAKQELEALQKTGLEQGERLHLGSGAPAWRKDGVYAFMSGNTLRFSDGRSSIVLPSRPSRLSWDGQALVYSRTVVRGATIFGEVFRLENGLERQLTTQARARDAIFDGRCIVYIEDYLDESSIRRLCENSNELVYAAPQGWHLFHPAPRDGRIALTVWRPGGFLDVALWNGKLEFLTSDAAQDQFPTWVSDDTLAFSSDRTGSAQLHQIRLGSGQAAQLTAAPGGAYISSLLPDGRLTFSSYTASGFETRIVKPRATQPVALEVRQPVPLDGLSGLEYPVQPYLPVPSPVFWYPATANGLGATVVGADPAGVLAWQLAGGFDFSSGWGANLSLNFQPSLEYSINLLAALDSSGYGLRLDMPFVGRGESQATGRVGYVLRPSVGLVNGVGFASLYGSLGALLSDDWGYLEYGWSMAGTLSTSGYSANLVLTDAVAGLPLTVGLGLRGGYLSQPNISASLQTQFSFGVRLRSEDGFVTLERLTVQPFALFSSNHTVGLRLLADGILNYYVPISLGLEFSYSTSGFGFRLVTVLPLEQLR